MFLSVCLTSDPCLTLFRPSLGQAFRCPFQDNCAIDTVTRRFCQKCRLKKCYTIGMKKEWIMTDEERKVKRQKIVENRSRKGDPAANGNVVGSVANVGSVGPVNGGGIPPSGVIGSEGFTPSIKAEQGSPYSADTSPPGWLPHSPVSPYRYNLASPGGPPPPGGTGAGAAQMEAPGPDPGGQRRLVAEPLKHCAVQVPDSPPEPTCSIDDG